MKVQPVGNLPDGWFDWFYYRNLIVFDVECVDDMLLKNMKMLILHQVFNDFG